MKPPKQKLCKVCKDKFTPSTYHPFAVWCSPTCGYEWQKVLKSRKEKETEKDRINFDDKEQLQRIKANAYPKKYKSYLQDEINKLSRMIDARFDHLCIDCGKPYGKQTDGAHYHGVGGNSSTRYNLHNIHSAKSDCNQYSDTHKDGYRKGIIDRYGEGYMEKIEGLPLEYKLIKLSNAEVYEKLTIVRKIIRDFDTYKFDSAIAGREIFNKIIGIYNL